MNKLSITLWLIGLVVATACHDKEEPLSTESLADEQLVRALVAAETTEEAQSLWAQLQAEEELPYTFDDSVYFFYEGNAQSVSWNGDFNGWGGNQSFKNKGTQISESAIWYLKSSFPSNARLDYKIVVDGQWITDSLNPHYQWTGVGGGQPNSELRMPDWNASEWIAGDASNKGTLNAPTALSSTHLGYTVNYRVYTPHGYTPDSQYPSLYVTDGHEYADDRLGAMINILDNLIEAGKIEPLVVIFIDPREVGNPGNNRRIDELPMKPKFAAFVAQELLPAAEADYSLSAAANQRGIMGTSLGGLFASYLHTQYPESFGLLAIQSPAYWYKPEIFNAVSNITSLPQRVSITTGVINDTQAKASEMNELYQSLIGTTQYIEVNEGHSWGNWKALIDDQLIYLFPVE